MGIFCSQPWAERELRASSNDHVQKCREVWHFWNVIWPLGMAFIPSSLEVWAPLVCWESLAPGLRDLLSSATLSTNKSQHSSWHFPFRAIKALEVQWLVVVTKRGEKMDFYKPLEDFWLDIWLKAQAVISLHLLCCFSITRFCFCSLSATAMEVAVAELMPSFLHSAVVVFNLILKEVNNAEALCCSRDDTQFCVLQGARVCDISVNTCLNLLLAVSSGWQE